MTATTDFAREAWAFARRGVLSLLIGFYDLVVMPRRHPDTIELCMLELMIADACAPKGFRH